MRKPAFDHPIDIAPRARHAFCMLDPLCEKTVLAATIAAALCLSGCGPVKRPDGGSGLLAQGAAAPDFEAKDGSGAALRLSDLRGKLAVVYFYPKDDTPGCTKQACAFRDNFAAFERAGIAVFGISRDSEASHREFRKKHSLPFALVADGAGDVQKSYGVPDKLPGLAQRVTFLVGRDGKVARVWPEVDPVLNVDQVLDAARQLGNPS